MRLVAGAQFAVVLELVEHVPDIGIGVVGWHE